jgi:hypothetical protein
VPPLSPKRRFECLVPAPSDAQAKVGFGSIPAVPWCGTSNAAGKNRIRSGVIPTPELAIEAACRLIDDGCDVLGIGTGPLADSISRPEITRIYAIWAKEVHQARTIG